MWATLFISGIIVGAYSAYIAHFFKSADKTSQYIEEAYLLSYQIHDYALNVLNQILLQVGLLKSKGDLSSLKNLKQVENPFPRLIMIMDLHLNLPEELLCKLSDIQTEILVSFRPIAEAINKSSNADELYGKSIIRGTEGVNKAHELSSNLLIFLRKKNLDLKNTTQIPNIIALARDAVCFIVLRGKVLFKKCVKSD